MAVSAAVIAMSSPCFDRCMPKPPLARGRFFYCSPTNDFESMLSVRQSADGIAAAVEVGAKGAEVQTIRPDLNTLFCQATDITALLAKFGRPWHYASVGRGALQRVWVAALLAVARSV